MPAKARGSSGAPPPPAAAARPQHLGSRQHPTFPTFAAAMLPRRPAGRQPPPLCQPLGGQDRPSTDTIAVPRQPTCLHRRLLGRADRGAAGTAVPRKPLRAPTAPAGLGQRRVALRAGNPNHHHVGSGPTAPPALTCGLGREAGASLHSAALLLLSWEQDAARCRTQGNRGRAGVRRPSIDRHCRGGGHAAPAVLPRRLLAGGRLRRAAMDVLIEKLACRMIIGVPGPECVKQLCALRRGGCGSCAHLCPKNLEERWRSSSNKGALSWLVLVGLF